jgi:hypothetical protein
VFRGERLCFLSYDDERHRLALIHIPGLPERDPDAVGTDHVAYTHNGLGELRAHYLGHRPNGSPTTSSAGRGTQSSNPVPSSKESPANLISGATPGKASFEEAAVEISVGCLFSHGLFAERA